MAYTKEQRAKKEAEKEEKLKAELEAKVKAELEEKMKAEMESKIRAEFEAKLVSESVAVESVKESKSKTITKIPLDTIVPVISNTPYKLKYVSKKTRLPVEWEGYNSVEYIELSELVSMRNTDKRFFEDNWIILEDADDYTALQIYDFLKVSKYYKNIFTPETIDTIFEKSATDIIKVCSTLSNGMKETIATRAKEKIDKKELDSNSKIEALESVLNVKFSI